MAGRLFAIVGPSGAGKDTLIAGAKAHLPDLVVTKRVITRPAAAGGEDFEGVTEAEQAFTMPRDENRTRVNYYLAWARTYLKRGDALNNSKRGVWALTETGSAISNLNATQAIYDQVTQEERERARLKRLAAKKADANRGEEIEVMADDGPVDEEDWKSALLAVLGKIAPDGFERLAQRLIDVGLPAFGRKIGGIARASAHAVGARFLAVPVAHDDGDIHAHERAHIADRGAVGADDFHHNRHQSI